MNNLIKTLFLRPAVAAFIFAMIVFLPVKAEAKTALEFDSEGNLTVTTRDKAAATEALKAAVSELDKATKKGIFHKNTTARKVSRMTKAVNALD